MKWSGGAARDSTRAGPHALGERWIILTRILRARILSLTHTHTDTHATLSRDDGQHLATNSDVRTAAPAARGRARGRAGDRDRRRDAAGRRGRGGRRAPAVVEPVVEAAVQEEERPEVAKLLQAATGGDRRRDTARRRR